MSYNIESLPLGETVTVNGTYTVTDSDVTSDTLTNIITASNAHINKTAQAVANVTAEAVTVPDVPASESDFNNMSWEDIKAMAEDCSENGSDKYKVMLGWQKDITYASPYSFSGKVQLVAFNNGEKSDGSGKAGFTFMTNILQNVIPISTSNATTVYSNSNLRAEALKISTAIPKELKNIIETTKAYSQNTPSDYTNWTSTDDDFFVPNFLNLKMGAGGGTTFDYFNVENNLSAQRRIRTYQATNNAAQYATSNFSLQSNVSACSLISVNGLTGGTVAAGSNAGLVVCFCI